MLRGTEARRGPRKFKDRLLFSLAVLSRSCRALMSSRSRLKEALDKINERQVSAEQELRDFLFSHRGETTLLQLWAVLLSTKRLSEEALEEAAKAFVALLDMHPAVRERGDLPVARAIFPDQQAHESHRRATPASRGGISRAIAHGISRTAEGIIPGRSEWVHFRGSTIISSLATRANSTRPKVGSEVGTLAALGTLFLGLAGRHDSEDLRRLWSVIAGADRLNTMLRNAFLGKPNEQPADPLLLLYNSDRELSRSSFLRVLRAQRDLAKAIQTWRINSHSTGIQNIDPPAGCTGNVVKINGNGFGSQQPHGVEVCFPSRSGDCLPAQVLSWSDTAISVVVPEDAGRGCVGFLKHTGVGRTSIMQALGTFVDEAEVCLGQAAGELIRDIYRRVFAGALKPDTPPPLYAAPEGGILHSNLFVGGAPVVRNFVATRSRGADTISGTSVEIQPDDIVALAWNVDHATYVSITPETINGLLNELPVLAGPFHPANDNRSISWKGGSIRVVGTYDWIGEYRLTARNACGTTSVFIRLCLHIPPQIGPGSFLWGVADAGRQVEGNLNNDDWEIFTSDPKILSRLNNFKAWQAPSINPQRAEAALNHWDLPTFVRSAERMQAIGLNTYRFSIEWSRIEPTQGVFDGAALANYQAMIDALRSRGMEPIVALNHLSLPAWVLTPPRWTSLLFPEADPADPDFKQSFRGWENVDTITLYLGYVNYVVSSLTGVKYWITFNEPISTAILSGYIASVFPPGFLADNGAGRAVDAIRNIVAAHAQAYLVIKRIDATFQVGITDQWLACKPALYPLATSRFVDFHQDFLIRALFTGHVLLKDWTAIPELDERLLSISEADWTPMLDFFGLQYYKSTYPYYFSPLDFYAPWVGARVDLDLRGVNYFYDGLLNDMGWEMFPQGLYECLMKLRTIAPGLPILVSENGTAETVDHNRASFITSHIQQMQRAQTDGANVIGYLHWSCADNWEWINGYSKEARFGLFSVELDPPNNPNKLHFMTDGALALSNIMRNPVMLQDTIDRFGQYSADGTTMGHPNKSPYVTFTGTVSAQPITLLLSPGAASTDPLFGMLFYQDVRRWVRLNRVIWDPTSRRLQFSHPGFLAGPQVQARKFVCSLDPAGQSGDGTVSEGECGSLLKALPLHITRLPFTGMWQTQSGQPISICLSCPESQWRARALLSIGEWSPWQSVAVHANGFSGVDAQGQSVTGSLSPTGDLQVQTALGTAGLSIWLLRRLPDGLPF